MVSAVLADVMTIILIIALPPLTVGLKGAIGIFRRGTGGVDQLVPATA